MLSACSPYFEAMITNGMVESNESSVTLCDSDKEVVETIIDYAYIGRITIEDSNVQSLLAASTLFQIEELQNDCFYYII